MAKKSLLESEAEPRAIRESVDAVNADTAKWVSEHLSPSLKPEHPYCLPLDDVDRVDVLCSQINAITDVAGSADMHDVLPQSMYYAMQAVRERVAELQAIANKRRPRDVRPVTPRLG